MKKRVAFLLLTVMLLTASLNVFSVSASAADTHANYYEWTFDDASLNDTENGIFYANTGNNSLTVKTPDDLTVANNVNSYLTNNTASAGYSVKQAERTGSTDLGNALYVCDRYLDFGTDINLKPKTAWRIEIVGNIPKGGMNKDGTKTSYGIGKTALFANETAKDYLFVDGADRAFYLYDNNYAFSVQSSNCVGVWSSSCRIGQQRVQKLVISNELHEDGHWYIHYQIAECYNYPNDAWNGQDTYFTASWDNRDWTFDGIGSNTYYITANPSGTNGYNPYFSSIKIWEDTSYINLDGVQVRSGDTAESESTSVRLVSTLKGLDWQEAGYVISLSNKTPMLDGENVTAYRTQTVYSSIGSGEEVLTASSGYYYIALKIDNIPKASFDTEIYIRPYVKDAEGKVIYGELASFHASELFS